MKRGLFIVVEGCDRSGKTTQCAEIIKFFNRNQAAVLFSFPNRNTETGKIIDRVLKKEINMELHALHLLFSANRWELQKEISDKLNTGIHVVCDRYTYSGLAYSLANGLRKNWCVYPDKDLILPDYVFYLDADPEEIQKRPGFGDEVYEDLEYQKNIRHYLNDIFKFVKNGNITKVFTINANQSQKDVTKSIVQTLDTEIINKSLENITR